MTILQAIILGLVQGLTEFLPVSSSGHLVLAQAILGLDDLIALKGFDIAVHFGTLMAIFIYFRKDYWELILALWQSFYGKIKGQQADGKLQDKQRMIGILVVGTIPAVIVGALLGDFFDEKFLNPFAVSVMMVIFALVFLVAEKYYMHFRQHQEIGWKEGILIGCGQALALIPGVSRSGATISTGLILGVERAKAARFSFLLGSVAMVAATVLAIYKVYKGEYAIPATDLLVTGIVTSFASGWLAISFLMNYLKKHSLAVFAWYRMAIVVVFWLAFTFISK
ncbi:undecaprenyl-diphosphate phosphatase [Candidatus Peregrinibacteria bacterium]|nr:undecaprenyl-diphosphate phosphatase [Candidatus Peregrinibacteria bacterium]